MSGFYEEALPYDEAESYDGPAIGGYFPAKGKPWFEAWKEKHALDADIEETLRHTYASIHEVAEDDPELSKQLEKLIKPVAEVRRGLPEPDQINYTLLARKIALMQQLFAIEQRLADEEAAIFLLLGH